jgi:uncharacterized protein YecE (DUF72 family)
VTVLIGTSGWQYQDWRGHLYPTTVPKARWLEHYASRFQTVELNNAFYRLPSAEVFAAWRERTPADFVIAVKASRYLTHVRRLREPAEPVDRLMDRARHLGGKLGPVLLQLPPNFRIDLPLLAEALGRFPPGVLLAFEPRHESWYVEKTATLLADRGVAFVLTDTPHRRAPRWRTASWGYLRFHEGRAAPWPCYGRTALARWAETVCDLWSPAETVFAYFNNDPGGCAVRDARWFARALARLGRDTSRVPPAREATLVRPGLPAAD